MMSERTWTNTFVEVQNHVLMDHVHVRANMTMQTMVTKEALIMDRKDRKFAHKNFRQLTTAASKTAEDAKSVVAKVCAFMQDVTTPEMGKLVTKQVSIAIECLENIETSWTLCSCSDRCDVCLQYMTAEQKNLSRTAHLAASLTMMMVAMIKVMSLPKQPKGEKVLANVKMMHDGNNIAMQK